MAAKENISYAEAVKKQISLEIATPPRGPTPRGPTPRVPTTTQIVVQQTRSFETQTKPIVEGVNERHTVQPGGEKKETREMSTQTEERIPTVITTAQITTQTETQTNNRPAEQQSTDKQTKKKRDRH